AHPSRHVAERDRPPRSQRPRGTAQKCEIAQPVEFGIVGHALKAIAESALNANEEPRLEPTVHVPAPERLPDAPLIEQERPAHLSPSRLRAISSGARRRSGSPAMPASDSANIRRAARGNVIPRPRCGNSQ